MLVLLSPCNGSLSRGSDLIGSSGISAVKFDVSSLLLSTGTNGGVPEYARKIDLGRKDRDLRFQIRTCGFKRIYYATVLWRSYMYLGCPSRRHGRMHELWLLQSPIARCDHILIHESATLQTHSLAHRVGIQDASVDVKLKAEMIEWWWSIGDLGALN